MQIGIGKFNALRLCWCFHQQRGGYEDVGSLNCTRYKSMLVKTPTLAERGISNRSQIKKNKTMKTTQNTVLITGGSAGIGFEIARLLSEKGNHVIILGRNTERLHQAAAKLANVTPIVCDVSSTADVEALVKRLEKEFPELNILINNAGRASVYKLANGVSAFGNAADEMQTNYLSVINLTEKLLPLLQQRPEAAIVNVTSVLALVPAFTVPTYSASKAALRSYTQILRYTLAKSTNIKVFELMRPLVNTEFSKEIGGHKGIAPSAVAERLVNALKSDEYEIKVGGTADVYKLFLSSPAQALAAVNQGRG